MAKNRRYENVYQITLSGNATNGFTPKVKQEGLMFALEILQREYPGQLKLEIVSTKGDFNAVTGEISE